MNSHELATLLNTLTRYEHQTDYAFGSSYSYMEPHEQGD